VIEPLRRLIGEFGAGGAAAIWFNGDVEKGQVPSKAAAEGLGHRLLGGEAAGKVGGTLFSFKTVGLFSRGKNAVEKVIPMLFDRLCDAVNLNDVCAKPFNGYTSSSGAKSSGAWG